MDSASTSYEIIDVNRTHDDWLVMVHGFSHNSRYFSRQIIEFQHQFRLLLVDLRGHGRSASHPGPFGIEEYCDDLQAVFHELGLAQVHYWGTHTGSAVGLNLALREPQRFASLILEGPFLPGFPMPRVEELLRDARERAQESGREAALEHWLQHADWFEYLREHAEECRGREHRGMLFEFSGRPWLSLSMPRPVTPVAEHLQAIQQPTLVYNGQFDVEEFRRAAEHLEERLPRCRRREIPMSGGFPAWENPENVNHVVRDFLATLSP